MNRYPEYILEILRLREGLGINNTDIDKYFNECCPNYVFKNVCTGEGLGGWDNTIKEWIKNIYGIDLNEVKK